MFYHSYRCVVAYALISALTVTHLQGFYIPWFSQPTYDMLHKEYTAAVEHLKPLLKNHTCDVNQSYQRLPHCVHDVAQAVLRHLEKEIVEEFDTDTGEQMKSEADWRRKRPMHTLIIFIDGKLSQLEWVRSNMSITNDAFQSRLVRDIEKLQRVRDCIATSPEYLREDVNDLQASAWYWTIVATAAVVFSFIALARYKRDEAVAVVIQ